jgi:hypothetical protein
MGAKDLAEWNTKITTAETPIAEFIIIDVVRGSLSSVLWG